MGTRTHQIAWFRFALPLMLILPIIPANGNHIKTEIDATHDPVNGLTRTCHTRLLVARQSSGRARIEVRATLAFTQGCDVPGGFYWGSTDLLPATVVKDLSIVWNAKKIVSYVSSFSDLGNIVAVRLIRTKSGYIIQFRSAGEEPYKADIYLSGYKIVRRRVYYPLFRDEAYEETIYHFTVE